MGKCSIIFIVKTNSHLFPPLGGKSTIVCCMVFSESSTVKFENLYNTSPCKHDTL